MPKPRKYSDLYGAQKAYLKTEKGKQALKRYQTSEKRRIKQRERARVRRGTIIDKQQWFIDTYGDMDTISSFLDEREQEVITLIYGLDGSEPTKQKDIAEYWGKSPQFISGIKKEALAKLEPLKQSLASSQS